MGSAISAILFQPILLGTAAAIMIFALMNQKKDASCKCDDKNRPTCADGSQAPKIKWGSKVFRQDMWIGAFIIIAAIIIQFIEGFQI